MIDCDVHNSWVSAEVLLPHLPPAFREYLERGEIPGPRGAFPHVFGRSFLITSLVWPLRLVTTSRIASLSSSRTLRPETSSFRS
jgi:hypothetical protein